MASEIHVISKKDLAKHETVSVHLPLSELGPSSVRASSSLLAITSNNLSYAKLGELLGWWDVWPVPADAPAPYNNRDEWGIVPAWGYGKVLESNVDAIPVGSLLYGYWPTSSHPVDLKLEAHDIDGHFREVNEYRQGPGSMYNRYNLVDTSKQSEDSRAIFANANPISQAGYVLNRFIFPTEFAPAHPTGAAGAGEWTDKQADLSSAVLVNLSASSRTGRSVAWNFARNREPNVNGPLALLNASSRPQRLEPAPEAAFEIRNVGYDSLAARETVDWIAGFRPRRVVVLDSGGPLQATDRLRDALASSLPASTDLTLVLIGGQPKLQSLEDFQADMGLRAKWNFVQLNTTAVMDTAMAAEGSEAYFRRSEEAFQRAVEEKFLGDTELVWGDKVSGPDGIEGAWENIIKGTLAPNKAWVYRLG
ncbi:hypothetical protein CTRI78_v007389 [Colletotrichum trifolii]|uniref:Uncharacterized protein n=1 Tax=Colletotrichum trifolii TaxID=5466 RepID=A0A4V3HVD0_COLTR|nr:hypothetical protein CTRI78_v007389 [Colletotrichum trifolii]